jgi:Transglutaminase-like superfamily
LRRLNRFARLSAAERRLLVHAFLAVASARACLWLLPFDRVRRVAFGCLTSSRDAYTVERVVWSVLVASRFVPHATCLTRALAAHALLTRSGHASRVEVGVNKDDNRFHAHAWVVCGGITVLGESEAERYTPLLAWERM